MRLSPAGAQLARELLAGQPARSASARALGRRLVDAGLARSHPPAGPRPTVTVLIPVRDRPEALRRCLAALGDHDPVLVVDDGSRIPVSVSAPHVQVLRRPVAGGPAAARASGLAHIATAVVACVDSDVVVSPGWLEPLLAHLADPRVGAVAPRIRPLGAATVLGRYLQARSPLDLGPHDLPVRPGSPVPFVPSAALVVRRELASFDPALRYGEDVDLVWRLLRAGHDVRYEPAVIVGHAEPETWWAAAMRRHAYGTAAGPLARRHPGALAHLRSAPLPLAAAAALTLAPVRVGAAGAALVTAVTGARLRRAGLPAGDAWWLAGAATGHAAIGLGRYLGQLALPIAAVAGKRRRRLLVLVALPGAVEWWRLRPPLDPVRFAVAALADDAAYGSGVWRGSLRARTLRPLLPVVGGRARPSDGGADFPPCPLPPPVSPTSA